VGIAVFYGNNELAEFTAAIARFLTQVPLSSQA
jgi:hypothetical protein